ncbi:MAG TPA: excinuclease ABC subunit UvrA [Elusimicrobia bacterium]|nr:excinuclease ABC subunit UvrA [Elusimicrobiota bacterium]HBT62750.1 excinuclease ABC subunit UvrA [Elusimicrobiota bacterium]
MDKIIIRGARQHNLKNISLTLPRGKLIVVTGLSGSGKSSLAFDTLYAEGQRRYVESLSAYARQFLEMMDKPDVDLIEGLSPAISIEQRNPSRNPRSTVATVTEIYDYLRLLYARVGTPHCPECGKRINKQSVQSIVNSVLREHGGESVAVYSPLVRGRTGTYEELFKRLKRSGFVSVRVDGKSHELDSVPALSRYQKHTIELFVDKLKVAPDDRQRLADSVELALKESKGLVRVELSSNPKAGTLMSEHHACPDCGVSLPELEPRLFSFNSPYGACPDCDGLGHKTEVSEELVVADPSLSISEGAITAWADPVTTRTNRWKRSWSGYYAEILEQVCRQHGIAQDRPWKDLPEKHRQIVLRGGGTYKPSWAKNDQNFEGVIRNLERRAAESESEFVKAAVTDRFMRKKLCPACRGARLKPESLAVKISGLSVSELTRLSVLKAGEFFRDLGFDDSQKTISRQILKEIRSRLEFLSNVGLDYLTLDRASETLAGGEAQRIHLATQIGSGLTGVLYVLDEPSIGLHPRDNSRLLLTLKRLRELGNTLVVVEHDEETMRNADWIVDLGPGAGVHGGHIVAQGPLDKILSEPKSLTGAYLSGRIRTPEPATRPEIRGHLIIQGARQFNLKNIDVDVPLGLLVCVTGVSGSGKSTLVHEVTYKALAKRLYNSKDEPGAHKAILGAEQLDKVIVVDQSPIGRTPRSNPATYTGLWTPIRELYAMLPQAKARGYKPGRFSFNVKGGRCENCQGDGTLCISMQFLPDVYVQCNECHGARFNDETLTVRYKGKNIAELLAMSVEEALGFLSAHPSICRVLQTLCDVGLGYMALGQSATTLSGGEAQRVKLASELCRRGTGRTLYILDEPTTGLHFADVDKLLDVLHRLVAGGNTVLVIEHNLAVIRRSDWLIDLGPEGGDRGGELVACGRPEDVAKNPESHTGRYLKEMLAKCC